MITKADQYMQEAIVKIRNKGYKDVNPRPHYEDGTPAHTYSINHAFRTYDLSKGEFPICTLRPIAWKTGIKEIMAFFQNQSNKISEFERIGCNWWGSWALADGTIGKAYPYNLESHRSGEVRRDFVKIPRRKLDETECKKISVDRFFPPRDSVNDIVYKDRYRVIGLDRERSEGSAQKYYQIQFVSNNYITSIPEEEIGITPGVNPYDRTICEVGYLGEYTKIPNYTQRELAILSDIWKTMIRKCYSNNREFDDLGNPVFVHPAWHSFEFFLQDIRHVPQFFLAKEDEFLNWSLDVSYYGSNAYSKDTCVFLKDVEKSLYAVRGGHYKITNINTAEVIHRIELDDFANSIGSNVGDVQRGITRSGKFKNFTFKFIKDSDDEEYVYRYEISRNQVNSLLSALKANPYGRRHIISFWNWANIDKKALVECAYETIWNVRNTPEGEEYLDMILVQRSGDMLTASGPGCINEVQYAALLLMVARHVGYKPGVFSHLVVNEQIYDRHMDASLQMLTRYAEKTMINNKNTEVLPQLILNPDKTNFYEFTVDDFSMKNYSPVKPQLKLELGI